MKVKLILPALMEAKTPFFRPIKYSLFPPLGLATLAAYHPDSDDLTICDEHVESIDLNDDPDLVVIQVYITNAFKSYEYADRYRARGIRVILGGLHVSALPDEAMKHADTIFIGPGEDIYPIFLDDLKNNRTKPIYTSEHRTLLGVPSLRRDLIKRHKYLVPNSMVVSRGCPHHCSFCYKDAFFEGGKGFYTQKVDDALAEIDRLPGRHLYFLDDHLLGNARFAANLFEGMKGMGRLFQGASTVDAILRGDLIEKARDAGLRSIFIGFESRNQANLLQSNKKQNLKKNYDRAIERLHDLGIMINGSFVFGLDEDDQSVFSTTVDWAIKNGLTTATFHILTPYPGTKLYKQMKASNRILHDQWNQYDTRTVVYKSKNMTKEQLEAGYNRAYREFYSWSNIFKASSIHDSMSLKMKHLAYMGGWKKFEPLWNFVIKTGALNAMRPLLEEILHRSKTNWIPEVNPLPGT